ncbi:MAG TPA: thioredoxin family protein [Vicinamibacterales bacterium]|nr:thioredoxin family protein [Vicinamibacterales bacterium]
MRRPKAEVTPLVERVGLHGGDTARAALRVSLPEGLHTQSNKPRDPLLIPTELTIDAPAGVTVTEVVFPPSTDLKQAGQEQPLAVFEQTFAIGVQLAIASSAQPGTIAVPFHLRYQACDANLCYAPSTAEGQWPIAIVAASKTASASGDAIFGTIAFGKGEAPGATASAPAVTRPGAAGPSPASGDGIAKLDQFTVLGMNGGYLNADEFLRFVHNAENGVKERGMFEGRGPLMILLLVLIGGLALNLTPCVLPMIPINLAIIGAGAQAGSRGRGFMLGSAYGVAMALVYGAIGLVVILTAGTFGTINSSPWFNLGIAILFFVLALAMFDVLLIDFSQYAGNLGTSSSKGSFALAFSMGAVAALLAGACVAPVVIQVVLFSSNLYATGTKVALALPFCLGIGMAIPWPIAGAGLAALPKPGMWMVRVKQAFGVFIMATALYYGYEAYAIFANRWVDPAAVSSSVEAQLKAGWHASLAQGLDLAQREQKPVLIDMWATWCKNCLTMDKTTLENADVQKALSGYIRIKYQAEDPDQPPAKTLMQRFNAAGLPTYVIVRPSK